MTQKRCYTVRKPKILIKGGQKISFDDCKKDFLHIFWGAIESKFSAASKEMYHWLIQPVEKYIKNLKDLVIIPDETLQLFPYHALITTSKNNIEKPSYLIEKYTIMYHYSIWYFHQSIGPLPQKNDLKFLGIGPYDFSHVPDPKLCKLTRTNTVFSELKKIHKGKPTMYFYGQEAVKATLFKHSKNSDHVFIFSHGQAPVRETDQPYLIFAPNKNDGSFRLHINDFVKNTDLSNTSLVTFCCCDSGNGRSYDGEGVVAFNKAAINLGAKTVIYTIGGASEGAAQDFMLVFNQLLADGKGRRKAFQLAYKTLIAEEKYSVRHWAVFAMIGSWKQNY